MLMVSRKKYLVLALGLVSIVSAKRLIADAASFQVTVQADQDACTQTFVRDPNNPKFFYLSQLSDCGKLHVNATVATESDIVREAVTAFMGRSGLQNMEVPIADSMQKYATKGSVLCVKYTHYKDIGNVLNYYPVNYFGKIPNCEEAKNTEPTFQAKINGVADRAKTGSGTLEALPPSDDESSKPTALEAVLTTAQTALSAHNVTANLDQFTPTVSGDPVEIAISNGQIKVTRPESKYLSTGTVDVGMMNLLDALTAIRGSNG